MSILILKAPGLLAASALMTGAVATGCTLDRVDLRLDSGAPDAGMQGDGGEQDAGGIDAGFHDAGPPADGTIDAGSAPEGGVPTADVATFQFGNYAALLSGSVVPCIYIRADWVDEVDEEIGYVAGTGSGPFSLRYGDATRTEPAFERRSSEGLDGVTVVFVRGQSSDGCPAFSSRLADTRWVAEAQLYPFDFGTGYTANLVGVSGPEGRNLCGPSFDDPCPIGWGPRVVVFEHDLSDVPQDFVSLQNVTANVPQVAVCVEGEFQLALGLAVDLESFVFQGMGFDVEFRVLGSRDDCTGPLLDTVAIEDIVPRRSPGVSVWMLGGLYDPSGGVSSAPVTAFRAPYILDQPL